jgi:hypothetical protein
MPIRQTLLATFQARMASFDSAMRSTAMLAMSGHELRSECLFFSKCQKTKKQNLAECLASFNSCRINIRTCQRFVRTCN